MSPRTFTQPAAGSVPGAVRRLWLALGIRLRDARLARQWTVQALADRAAVSRSVVYLVEAGEPTSTEAAVRLATAMGLRLELELVDPRRRSDMSMRSRDPVHSAMGELEAAHLRRLGYPVGIDEPYQHYQFAGRADVAAWDIERRALLHLENRTRFPDLQQAAGSYNAKRAYLAASLGSRLGIRRWAAETHLMVALWSAEVLHALRLRPDSFRSICPDPPAAFAAWWTGDPPASGVTSTLIVLDPVAAGRQRPFIGLEEALAARPRHRGYAEAVAKLVGADGRYDARG